MLFDRASKKHETMLNPRVGFPRTSPLKDLEAGPPAFHEIGLRTRAWDREVTKSSYNSWQHVCSPSFDYRGGVHTAIFWIISNSKVPPKPVAPENSGSIQNQQDTVRT